MYDYQIIERLKLALKNKLPGKDAHSKMSSKGRPLYDVMPDNAKESGVLVSLWPSQNDWQVLLIERAIDGKAHSGQIAFPGGKKEPFDINIQQTALREANEEVNLSARSVEIIGSLSPLFIPVSNYAVFPTVAVGERLPTNLISNEEVQSIHFLPLHRLLDEQFVIAKKFESEINGIRYTIDTLSYQLNDQKYIWGATAMILSELQTLLERNL